MAKKYIEKRKRGVVGYIFLGLFWAANALMVVWLFSALAGMGGMEPATSEAEQTGRNLGMAMGVGMILFFWAALAGITGLLAYMTRGRKEITEVES